MFHYVWGNYGKIDTLVALFSYLLLRYKVLTSLKIVVVVNIRNLAYS